MIDQCVDYSEMVIDELHLLLIILMAVQLPIIESKASIAPMLSGPLDQKTPGLGEGQCIECELGAWIANHQQWAVVTMPKN